MSQHHVAVGQVGIDFDGTVDLAKRLVELAFLGQGIAEIEMGQEISGLPGHRQAVLGNGLVETPHAVQCRPEVVHRNCTRRVLLCPTVKQDCFIDAVLTIQSVGQRRFHLAVVRVARQGPAPQRFIIRQYAVCSMATEISTTTINPAATGKSKRPAAEPRARPQSAPSRGNGEANAG